MKVRQFAFLAAFAAVLLWACPGFAAAPPPSRARRAIVIGINNYENAPWPRLKNAVADAEGFSDCLQQSFGYSKEDIHFLPNPAKAQIENAFAKWLPQQGLRRGDSLIVFFAGHGDFRNGQGYLAAKDSRNDESRKSCFEVRRLRKLVGDDRAGHKLVILDCCFSATVFLPENLLEDKPFDGRAGQAELPATSSKKLVGGRGVRGSIQESELDDLLTKPAFVGLTAGAFGPVLDSSKEGSRHSPFTRALLGHLEKRADSPRQSHAFRFEELAIRVRADVAAGQGGEVVPRFGRLDGNSEGDFVFVPPQPDTAKTPQEERYAERRQNLGEESTAAALRGEWGSALRLMCQVRALDPSSSRGRDTLKDQVQLARGLCARPRFLWTHPPMPERSTVPFVPKAVHDAVFHPSGKVVATAGADEHIRFWNVETGKPSREPLTPPQGERWEARCLAYSPKGDLLAAGLDDGRIAVWGPPNGTVFSAARQEGPRRVLRLEFSRDGKRLLAVDDLTVRAFDIGVAKPVFESSAGVRIAAARLSPDASRVAVALSSGSAVVYDLKTGQPLLDPKTGKPTGALRHGGKLSGLAFRPDGQVLATAGDDGDVKFWDTVSGKYYESTIQIDRPIAEVNYPSGDSWETLFITNIDGETLRYARSRENIYRRDRRQLIVLPWHGDQRRSPDGRLLLVPQQGAVYLQDLVTSGQPVQTFHGYKDLQAITFAPDSESIMQAPFPSTGFSALTGTAHRYGGLSRFDLGSTSLFDSSIAAFDRVVPLAMTPDARLVLVASLDLQTIEVRDSKTGKRTGEALKHDAAVVAACLSTDGRRAMTVTVAPKDVAYRFWDVGSGTLIKRAWVLEDALWRLTGLAPDGKTAFTVRNQKSREGTLRVWDVDGGRQLAWSLPSPTCMPTFTPDGTRVVLMRVLKGKQTLSGVDVRSGKILFDADVGQFALDPFGSVLVVSPDGQRIALGDSTGTVGVWSIEGNNEWIDDQHRDAITSLVFSPDGRRLALGSLDRTAAVVDLDTRSLITPLLPHRGPVLHVAFSPDGSRLATLTGNEQSGSSLDTLRQRIFQQRNREAYAGALETDREALLLSDDKKVRVWKVEGDLLKDTFGQVVDLLLTGHEFTEGTGEAVAAPAIRLARAWHFVTENYQEMLATTKPAEIAWHYQALLDCRIVGNHSGVLLQASRLNDLDPTEWRWLMNRAQSLVSLKEYKNALAAFEVAGKLPGAAGSWYFWRDRGGLLRTMNEPSLAVASYSRAIDLRPRDWSLYWDRAGARWLMKDYLGAEKDFRKVLELQPPPEKVAPLQYYLGYTLAEQGSYQEAAEAFDAVAKAWPAGDSPPEKLDGVTRLSARLMAMEARLARGDKTGYQALVWPLAREAINSTDPWEILAILRLLSLDPPGKDTSSLTGAFSFVYETKLTVHPRIKDLGGRYSRMVFGGYLAFVVGEGRFDGLPAAMVNDLIQSIQRDETGARASVAEKRRGMVLLAFLSLRAKRTADAARWAKAVREQELPKDWDRSFNWSDRLHLATLQARFDKQFPVKKE